MNNESNLIKVLAKNIKTTRLEKGLSQKQLAEKVGIKQNALSQFETEVRTPGMLCIQQLASALDVSMAYLLGETKSK